MSVRIFVQSDEKNEEDDMDYLSIKQTSEKWGVSTRRIQVLCAEDRIPGATKIGSYWAIPADAEKPKDERVKNGRYVKSETDYKSIKRGKPMNSSK